MVERLAAAHRLPDWERRETRLETTGRVAGRDVLLVEPLTYMNRSGEAIAALRRERPFELDELLVCYDDLDLPLGRIRIRPGGSAGTHNGMRSIVERLQTGAFPRVRVGIHPTSGGVRDAAEFVLRPFRRNEVEEMALAEARAADAIEVALAEGLDAAMNRFNPDPDPQRTDP